MTSSEKTSGSENLPALCDGGVSPEARRVLTVKGDLGKLTPDQQEAYYIGVCNHLGLAYITRPFDFLTLKGPGGERTVLYARKDATEQLRKKHHISLEAEDPVLDEERGVVTVKVTARMSDGRSDQDFGSSSVCREVIRDKDDSHPTKWAELVPLTGKDYENAVLRAVTKGKRRVTLSICGLGFLDESEIETIPARSVVSTGPVTTGQMVDIREAFTNSRLDLGKFLARYSVAAVEDLTEAQATELIGLHRMATEVNE